MSRKKIEKRLKTILFESDKKIVSLDEIITILTDSLPEIEIEELKNTGRKKWGNPDPIVFDYGEIPSLINPADGMGWDIIISPDADKTDELLRIVGYVPIKSDADKIPPPFGNKPGNHKLILGKIGRISQQAITKLKNWFKDTVVFDPIVFLPQNNTNMYRLLTTKKQSALNEQHVMYYAGTTTKNKVKNKLKKWNKEPVIVTADVNIAKDIAKDSCRRNGGNPVIYRVQPMGNMLPISKNSTSTFIVNTANIVGEIEESWEKATFGSYKLGHVNDGRWGGVAVGPTAKKAFNLMKEGKMIDKPQNRCKNVFSQILLEKDEQMNYKVFVDMDGVLVDFLGGFKERFRQSSLNNKLQLKDEKQFGSIEDQIREYFLSQAENEKQKKNAHHKATAYFWAIIPGLELGLKKRKEYTSEDYNKFIKNTHDFWKGLDWLPDGKQLWNYLVDLKASGTISELNILSSPSSDQKIIDEEGNVTKRNLAEEGKRLWLEKQGIVEGKNVDRIIIKKDKYEEADRPTDILIDDTPKKLYGKETERGKKLGWVDAGGTGILHKNTKDTIEELNNILKEE